MTDTPTTPTAARGNLICLLLVAFTAVANPLVQSWGRINTDVAFLTWTASEVLGPKVFGIDLYEVNLPLAFMIYSPAAFLAPFVGYVAALKIWITFLSCLSVLVFWHTADPQLRLPLSVMLVLFLVFVFPGQFGQREYIALMLTAPYVAGPARNRGWAILSGVMAGVGFAIKPFFLIPLVMVFATRRRIRSEELAIAATGLAYAAALLLFFQPYLFDFVPLARATYWATHMKFEANWKQAGFLLLSAFMFSIAGTPQPEARGFGAAALGFIIAAFLQWKGFAYHYHAAWGFLALLLVARCFNTRRIVSTCAVLNILVLSYMVGQFTVGWFAGKDRMQDDMAMLLPEVNRAPSYLSFAMGPFPGFPTALYTSSEYKGVAIWPIFISAAIEPTAPPELRDKAARLTFDQATRELAREPELVIVRRPGMASGWERPKFDLLGFLQTDPGFRAQWAHYAHDKTLGMYELYRRKPDA